MLERSRPLSPFLHYRWQYTNTLSILHRATGIVLAANYLLLLCWLLAVAEGPREYAQFVALLGHPTFKVLFALGFASFTYHLCNGVRHLTFDAGFGLERLQARRSGWIVIVVVVLALVLVGGLLRFRGGGAL